MNIFKLEEYLSKYEFSAQYLLCCSDSESFAMSEIIELAGSQEKDLWNNLRLGYTEATGLPALRETVAHELYPGLESDNILVFAGAEVTEVELKEENNWWVDLNTIRDSMRPNTKCIIINFLHNPTGQVIEEEELQALVDLCASQDIWLFSDEVYRLLGKPSEHWAPPAASIYDKALSLGVMSKSFGMAGLRIRWVACQNKDLLKKIEQMKHYTSICNSAPAEILSLISLKSKDKILQRNNKIVSDNLKLLDEFFIKFSHLFEWVRPQGGCVGFIKYKGPGSVDSFCNRLVNKQNVLLMPASIYDYQNNHFRIGFGRKNMPECLDQLKEFLCHENM